MKQVVACSLCGADLSVPLEIRSLKDPAVPSPIDVMGEPVTPRGYAYKSWQPQEWSMDATHHVPLQFVPQFWLHPADVSSSVTPVADHRKLSGCCGLSGSDGPNQRCACGASIGTLRNDCWTDHVFVPDPAATLWKTVS